jgi:hypothetical protein
MVYEEQHGPPPCTLGRLKCARIETSLWLWQDMSSLLLVGEKEQG